MGKWLSQTGVEPVPSGRPGGGELFYQNFECRIEAARYRVKSDSFVPEKPRLWSETPLANTGIFHAFDVAPDGKRVVALLPSGDRRTATLARVLVNVGTELRRRAQPAGSNRGLRGRPVMPSHFRTLAPM